MNSKAGFVSETWVSVYCHGCGGAYEEDDGQRLFTSVEAAMSPLEGVPTSGWQVDGDTVTCAFCLARAQCAEHGHTWRTEWSSRFTRANSITPARRCSVCDVREPEVPS